MSNNNESGKKLTIIALISMIFTTVFGFSNIPTGYMMMGYAAIPWYILASIAFFVPYAMMVSEYGMAFKEEKGGIFTWMHRSVNMKYGFMGVFMWYTAFIIYFVNVSTAFFIKISAFIFGEDRTSTWSILGLGSNQTIGLMAIVMIVLVAFVASKGIKNVALIARIGSSAILVVEAAVIIGSIVILIGHHGQFMQPISGGAFFKSPNASYTSLIGMLSFITMAVSAYGGIETTGGLVDKIDNPKKVPKALLGAVIAITASYAVLIFCLGTFINWNDTLAADGVNFANVQYIVMYNLGYEVGNLFGSAATAAAIGNWFTRFYGLAAACMTLGSITVFFYGPLTQLIEGTPKEIWPEWLIKKDEKTGIPVNAMWVQTGIICVFLLLISFGGTSVGGFWNLILLMTNVAMTIPYMFVAGAFWFFKKNEAIEKPVTFFHSQASARIWTVIVVCTIGFANLFTIISPAFEGDLTSTILQIVGPALFALLGLLLYKRYTKKTGQ